LHSERADRGSEETISVQNNENGLHPSAWRVSKTSPRRTVFRVFIGVALSLAFAFHALTQDLPAAPAPKPPLAQAESLLNDGKTDEALALLTEFAAKDPTALGLETMLGKAYFQSKKFPQAILHLKVAVQQNPEDLESIQLLALTFFASGDFQQALPLLEKLGPQLPKSNADGPYLLGICYIMTQRWDDARKTFAQMFSVSPDSGMAYLMLGKILIRQRLEDRAVPQIEKALQLDARLPMAHFLLGEIDLYKKDAQAAVSEFQKELAINPTVWLVYWRLGDAYVRLENYDAAERVLKEAVWLNEQSSGAFILLGQIALKRGESGLAVGFLERALRLDSQNYWVHYFLAKAYHNLGRTAEANQHFEISKTLRDDRLNEDRNMMQAVP
jgi:tetratricopeptide (TPR) repeat protein